ncbi:hypothetical protein YOLOSWAG_283 [Erwinia phage vB_EamM_Yoloswag]|uniref:Uncharacterized protein n=1 Tax=Erwinia phage vB_EamM_Yoloswag TaxID=1958956 RepID=A0A1S6L3J4_9CAUD|nr:hypothetical protein HOR66_gp283 [Erwinia phage vB_EamM_Yoloswag]AQT28754.1 hypothetical protein YOLOSWAG_283 [Erwinia phage vB_EamM_Yoloswag]
MSNYLVHNALVPFKGDAYKGPLLQELGYGDNAVADFPSINEAVECADNLHAVNDSGWLVVHSFNERVLYDSRAKQRVG